MKKILFCFILIFISGISLVSAVDVGVCQNITSSGYYVLNTSLNVSQGTQSPTESCLRLKNSNIWIDLNGYSVIGNSSTSFGVSVQSSQSNVSIFNGTISGFSSKNIDFLQPTNSTFYNLFIENVSGASGRGIHLRALTSAPTSGNNVTNVSFNNIGHISLTFSALNNSLASNISSTNSGNASDTSVCVYNFNSEFSNISYNTLSGCSNGIYLEGSGFNNYSRYSFVNHNNLSNIGLSTSSAGLGNALSLDNATNNTFFNNLILNSKNGVRISHQSEGNNISSNNNSATIGFFISSNNVLFPNQIHYDNSGFLKIGSESSVVNGVNYYTSIPFIQFNTTNHSNVSLFQLDKALTYNSNGTVYGSNNISSNNGNLNFSFPLNSVIYTLNNFNLTEGVTRSNSPLAYVTSNNLKKEVNSSLITEIYSPINFLVESCSDLFLINYVQANLVAYELPISSYSCQDLEVSLTSSLIYPSSNSYNEFNILYQNQGGGGSSNPPQQITLHDVEIISSSICKNEPSLIIFNPMDKDQNSVFIDSANLTLGGVILSNKLSFTHSNSFYSLTLPALQEGIEEVTLFINQRGKIISKQVPLDYKRYCPSLLEVAEGKVRGFGRIFSENQVLFMYTVIGIILSVILVILFSRRKI